MNSQHRLFGEFNFTHRRSINIQAPAPFTAHSADSLNVILQNSDLTLSDIAALDLLFAASRALFLPAANPFNPTGEDVGLLYRPVAAGPRTEEQTVNTFRVVTGLEGSMTPNWEYETAVFYARNHVLGENRNAILRSDLQALLMGVIEGADGNPLFLNPFGDNSQEVLDLLSQTVATRNTTVDQGVSGEISGSLFSMPAGEVGFAFGGEYREMSLVAENSIDRNRGEIVGTGSASDTRGEREVSALYAETVIPLLEGLELQAALRWEDYSDFGTTTNPKIGLKWQPIDSFIMRASWGESFRAPSLFELFNGSVTSFNSVEDPLRCPDGPGGENFPTTTDIDCGNGQFRVENGGNPLLEPETAEAYNFGFVWNPDFLDGLEMAVDFWRFEQQGVIDNFPLSILIQLNDPTAIIRGAPTPEDIAAGAPGAIAFINNSFVNAGEQETQGVDFDISYSFNTDVGSFRTQMLGTWVDTFELTTPGLVDGEIVQQTFEGVGNTALDTRPEWRLRGGVTWASGNHSVNGFANWRDAVQSDDDLVFPGLDPIPYEIPSFLTVDLQYTYDMSQSTTIAVGCINCLDRDPPFNNEDTEGFLLDSDDPRGARVYGRLIVRF